MKHVVVDLEMNRVAQKYTEEAKISGMEIIEIGAVVLDEQYQEIGCFKTLVKPQYNEVVEKYYTNLTGITTDMVEGAPKFEDALKQFLQWCHSLNDELIIYQWSQTDLDQITKEMLLKGIAVDEEHAGFLENWKDFQSEFGDKLHVSDALSLKKAVLYAGIEFSGRAHDALHDARTTAELLKIIRTPKLREAALGHVIEALTPKKIGTTLGDLFDFHALGLGA